MVDFIRYILNIDNLIYIAKVLLLWVLIAILVYTIFCFIKNIALDFIDIHYKKKFYKESYKIGVEGTKKLTENMLKSNGKLFGGDINNDK